MKIMKALTAIAIATATCTMPAFAQITKLTDPEVASVAVVANQIDIGYADIAKKKSKDKDVLQFA